MKLFIMTILMAASLHAADDLKAFPSAGEGIKRFVIYLPPSQNEDLLKLELLIGKTVLLDQANHYFFGGRLQKKSLMGWGYDYYELKELGPMAGTLMAVDPKQPKVVRFVTLGGASQLLRYNSRLPLVVYVPDGVDVRYCIWRADHETEPAAEN